MRTHHHLAAKGMELRKLHLMEGNFYIGGYQPAQKWLKDRKGKSLTLDDIRHYFCIVYVLRQTDASCRKYRRHL